MPENEKKEKVEELNKEELEKINGGYYIGGQITPMPNPGESGKSPEQDDIDQGNVGWPILIGIPTP